MNADEALDILRGSGGQTVVHGSDLWRAIERALVEIDRLRSAAWAVTLSASPRSPDGRRRSVDANALFALDELAVEHRVAPTYVSVKADEVEHLRAIEKRLLNDHWGDKDPHGSLGYYLTGEG